MRTCKRCKLTKSLTDYHRYQNGRYADNCQDCQVEMRRRRESAHKRYRLERMENSAPVASQCDYCAHLTHCNSIVLTGADLPCQVESLGIPMQTDSVWSDFDKISLRI